jgi:hypothetical protein
VKNFHAYYFKRAVHKLVRLERDFKLEDYKARHERRKGPFVFI